MLFCWCVVVDSVCVLFVFVLCGVGCVDLSFGGVVICVLFCVGCFGLVVDCSRWFVLLCLLCVLCLLVCLLLLLLSLYRVYLCVALLCLRCCRVVLSCVVLIGLCCVLCRCFSV